MTNTNQQLEIWKDIPNYEGIYQASSLGRIKSLDRLSFIGRKLKGKIMLQSSNGKGYLVVNLTKNNKQKTILVYVLVAMAFLDHIPCGLKKVVDHKDNNPTNNNLDNLQIITNRKNSTKDKNNDFIGVEKQGNKWRARIYINGFNKNLGSFKTELEASEYYKNAVLAIDNNTEIIVKEAVQTSKHIGVYWNKSSNRWVAQIRIGGKQKYLGGFFEEEYASTAYKNALNTL